MNRRERIARIADAALAAALATIASHPDMIGDVKADRASDVADALIECVTRVFEAEEDRCEEAQHVRA